MSSALPYLQKLRKPQLADWADATDLQNYEEYNKPELAAALDRHLQTNQSIFQNDGRLAEYYRRLSQSPRIVSPIKRESRVEATPSKVEPLRSARRGKVKARGERAETEQSDESEEPSQPTAQTPGRSLMSVRPPLPPSPAVVTDAIDRQAAAWNRTISDAWSRSGIQEHTHSVRSTLSSMKAVETLVVALEYVCLVRELMPLRFLVTVPAVEAIHTPDFAIKLPDLFILVDGAFWAPLSLWVLTSVLLPLMVAYFFNLSQQAGNGPAHSTRRARPAQSTFDPLSFNIAKALIAYLVYANHFNFWNLYGNFSIERVNASVPGRWPGILTGAAIGVIGTLYEAILKK